VLAQLASTVDDAVSKPDLDHLDAKRDHRVRERRRHGADVGLHDEAKAVVRPEHPAQVSTASGDLAERLVADVDQAGGGKHTADLLDLAASRSADTTWSWRDQAHRRRTSRRTGSRARRAADQRDAAPDASRWRYDGR